MEFVRVVADHDNPSPAQLKDCFAEVFAVLDLSPRPLFLTLDARNASGAAVSIDLADGEPVFRIDGRRSAKANFRRRWLAEHPVPLDLRDGRCQLVLEPTTGNRVRVRLPAVHERLAAIAARIKHRFSR